MTDPALIHDALRDAGLPVDGVRTVAGIPMPVYTRALSGPEQSAADAVMASLTPATLAARRLLASRALARAEAVGDTPASALVRAVARVIHASIAQRDQYLATLRQALAGAGIAVPAPPATRTWEQLISAALAQIDQGGGDPPP
jgi:hypothetical protein